MTGAVTDPRLTAVVAAILGPNHWPGGVVYRSPRPGYGAQRLHADAVPQLDRSAPATCATAIVALTDFGPDNGATRVVPGSHRRPDLQRRSGSLDDHPDAVTLQGRAGTAFVFSGHLLHGGSLNRSDRPRPALQVVFGVDEDPRPDDQT